MSPKLSLRREGCLSDLALDRLLAHEGGSIMQNTREHIATCERCRTRMEALRCERDAFVAHGPSLDVRRGDERSRRASAWRRAGGAALILAAAAVFVLWLRPRDRDGIGETQLKGHAHLGFYVKHHDVVTLGTPGQCVQPGDSLRFVYTSAEPVYFAILSLDGAGHASAYYPISRLAERVEPAVARPLESSTVLDDTLGNEHIYGIFCRSAIALEPLRSALEAKGTLPEEHGCDVDMITIRKEHCSMP
jgi:hypothetical protein